jgi:hypothetical protein
MVRAWHTPRLAWHCMSTGPERHTSCGAPPELQSGCRFERFWTLTFALLAPLTKHLRSLGQVDEELTVDDLADLAVAARLVDDDLQNLDFFAQLCNARTDFAGQHEPEDQGGTQGGERESDDREGQECAVC